MIDSKPNVVTVPKMLDKGSVVGAVRKLLGKSAPPICPKRPIIQAVNKILRYAGSTSAGKIGIMRNNNNWNKALRDLQFLLDSSRMMLKLVSFIC